VDYISASALRYDGNTEESTAFLGFIATVPYDGAQPNEARQWVEQSMTTAESQSAIFGGIPFELYGEMAAKTLTIGVFK